MESMVLNKMISDALERENVLTSFKKIARDEMSIVVEIDTRNRWYPKVKVWVNYYLEGDFIRHEIHDASPDFAVWSLLRSVEPDVLPVFREILNIVEY